MAVYTNDLRLKEIATGDESGTWGTSTNTNLSLIADAFGFGTEAITTNADTHTTTIADGSADPGRSIFLKYTGTLDSACTITIGPNTVSKLWFIENATSGSQNIIISQGSGANITIPPGDTKAIYSDGAGSGAAMVDAFASLNVVDLKVEDDLTVTDDLIVNGDIDLEGSIDVNGTANLDVVDIDGAVDMASTLQVDGAITSSSAATITTADNLAQLTLISTDTDSSLGPVLDLNRNPGEAGADDDFIGQIFFTGHNDAGTPEDIIYAKLTSQIKDASDGTEDGNLVAFVMSGGSRKDMMRIGPTESVFNESSNDLDFRVESNGNANMFFIDGADDAVVIGNNASRKTLFNTTATAAFQIEGTSGNTAAMSIVRNSNDDNGPQFVLGKSNGTSAGAVTVVTDDALLGRISFQGADGTQTVEGARVEAFVDGTPGADDMPGRLTFSTTADGASTVTERARIDSTGALRINNTRTTSTNLHVVGGTTSGTVFDTAVFAGGQNSTSGSGARIYLTGCENDPISRGTLIQGEATDNSNAHALVFKVSAASSSPAERLRITSAGLIGIGTSSPTNILDTAFTASAHTSGISATNLQSGGFGSVIAFNSTRSDDSSIKTAARIGTQGHENWSSDNTCSSNLLFETRKDNTLAERMRIVTDGKVGVGITTPDARLHVMDGNASATSNAAAVLTVENDDNCFIQMLSPNTASQQLRFGDPQDDGAGSLSYNHSNSTMNFSVNGPVRMSIDSSGSVSMPDLSSGAGNADLRFNTGNGDVTFDTSSRLVKEDIEDIPYGLDAVKKLSPKKYKRTDGDKNVEVGFIADEVVEVVPELVGMMAKSVFTGEELDTEEIAGSVNYSKMTAILVKAIQEQQVLIEALQTKVAALEGGS